MGTVVSFIAAYLLGSISFSYLLTKIIMKEDIRNHGSGNAGATNTLRVLGVVPAVSVLLLDVIKGIVAIWIARMLGCPDWAVAISGLLAIIGHNWPVFFGFRGGKGVATTIGVFASLSLVPSLYAGAIAILLIVLTRFVSLGSLLFVVLAPIFWLILSHDPPSYFYIGLLIAILTYWRHRSNLKRLMQGKENKIGKKGKK